MLQAKISEHGTPFSTYTSASKLYDELDRIARKSQRQQEKFIFLDLDDLNKNVDDRVVEQLICKIFSDDFKSFFFKGFLPVRFRAFTDTYQPLEIRWTVQDLIHIIQQRMIWASGGKKQSLAQICASELQMLNPDQSLARTAATPRELLSLGQRLLICHSLHWKPEGLLLLGRNDWGKIRQEMGMSPFIIPSLAALEEEYKTRDIISFALRCNEEGHLLITNVVEGRLIGKPI
ncbi:MAG: hypothetical protein DRI37_02255, partial [Chloroflexi bacterium]